MIGALITETLTEYGHTFVYETAQEGEEIGEFWVERFDVYFHLNDYECEYPGCEDDNWA